MNDLAHWTPRPRPARTILEGRYVRLEPLDLARHGDALYEASSGPDAESLFRYLFESPFETRAAFDAWAERSASSEDPMFFAVIDRSTGRAEGRLALMRIDPAHGVIETGSILFGPRLARTRGATEAIFLQAAHVFDELGYRRLEWKCNALNEPSRRAALRLGFTYEGSFRQHMVVKGESRDTAWFSITDAEWPRLKRAFGAWLDPSNFDGDGRQVRTLASLRGE